MTSMTKNDVKDNHQRILGEAQKLIERVEQAYHQGEAVHEVERGLFRHLLRMGHQLLELLFSLSGSGDQGSQLSLTEGQSVNRLESIHPRAYQSVFGSHQLDRTVYGSREGQKIVYVPLDHQLQLPANKFSYLLQEWDQSLAVEQPYGQVNETIERILGFKQSVHSLERINGHLSSSVEAFWDERPAPPVATGKEIVVCSADGKGVVIRGAKATTPSADDSTLETENGAAQADGKKMALIGAVYTVDAYVRTPEQVLNALFAPRDSQRSRPPPRPKPIAKYVRASLSRDALDRMAPSYTCIFSWLAEQQRQRNPTANQPVVLLMDGQRSLWAGAQPHFKGVAYIEVLDLMHALGYVWDAADLFYPSDDHSQRLGFVRQQVQRLLNGQVEIVIRSLFVQGKGLPRAQREALTDIIRYFRNNAPRMQYDQYLQAGYPIASGVIEGACRHVVCDRMEHSGMRWVMPGAQAMLKLRCIGINQDWEAFMTCHVARENKRLYAVGPANDDDVIPQPVAA